MDRLKCEGCGREVKLLAEGAIAYWCPDCKKLHPLTPPKVRKKRGRKPKAKATETKIEIPTLLTA